tara:strand:+ start:1756 stop:1887 length:132 start_codon:yes stop_codon:yes gene_type:complete
MFELDAAMLPNSGEISKATSANAIGQRFINMTRAGVCLQSNRN